MTAIVSIVTSSKCHACRTCRPLINKVSIKYPDVIVNFMDFDDPLVQRFAKRNLQKPVSSLKDEEMRKHYQSKGIKELSGLPTIFIRTDRRPHVIIDMLIGCVGEDADWYAKEKMMTDIKEMFDKAIKSDIQYSSSHIGRTQRRNEDYGL